MTGGSGHSSANNSSRVSAVSAPNLVIADSMPFQHALAFWQLVSASPFLATYWAPGGRVFAHLDDHTRLAAHMSRRTWRMGWGRLDLHLDERAGRAVGSRIRLEGRILGVVGRRGPGAPPDPAP